MEKDCSINQTPSPSYTSLTSKSLLRSQLKDLENRLSKAEQLSLDAQAELLLSSRELRKARGLPRRKLTRLTLRHRKDLLHVSAGLTAAFIDISKQIQVVVRSFQLRKANEEEYASLSLVIENILPLLEFSMIGLSTILSQDITFFTKTAVENVRAYFSRLAKEIVARMRNGKVILGATLAGLIAGLSGSTSGILGIAVIGGLIAAASTSFLGPFAIAIGLGVGAIGFGGAFLMVAVGPAAVKALKGKSKTWANGFQERVSNLRALMADRSKIEDVAHFLGELRQSLETLPYLSVKSIITSECLVCLSRFDGRAVQPCSIDNENCTHYTCEQCLKAMIRTHGNPGRKCPICGVKFVQYRKICVICGNTMEHAVECEKGHNACAGCIFESYCVLCAADECIEDQLSINQWSLEEEDID